MNEAAIRTEELTRDYGRFRALDRVNLTVEPGRVVALLGPNGAGKTTLLRLLMGLLEPTEGCSWMLGTQSRALPADVLSRVGYMGDAVDPPSWATIRGLVDLQADAAARFDRDQVRRFLESRQLKLGRTYGSLSKGQKKWVQAGLILAVGAEVLLLDEPAEGLDPAARVELYDWLRDRASQSDASVVVATHVISDIERIADDVAIIDRGRLVVRAALEDLREQVRQIEWPAAEALPVWPEGVGVLGCRHDSDIQLVWVRCAPGAESHLEAVLSRRAVMRGIGLETFYLAVTAHARPTEMILR